MTEKLATIIRKEFLENYKQLREQDLKVRQEMKERQKKLDKG
jgi:hypothetical protein